MDTQFHVRFKIMLIKCLLNLQETVEQECNPKYSQMTLIDSLVKLSERQNHKIVISKAIVTSTIPII